MRDSLAFHGPRHVYNPGEAWRGLHCALMAIVDQAGKVGDWHEDERLAWLLRVSEMGLPDRSDWLETFTGREASRFAALLHQYLETHTGGYQDPDFPQIAVSDVELGRLADFFAGCHPGGFSVTAPGSWKKELNC